MIWRFPLRRKISLLVTIVFVAALAVINHGCSRSGAVDGDELDSSFDLDLNNPNLKERLGEDNGYAFAILYGADIHGSLETCG
jgi:hypothetical protein